MCKNILGTQDKRKITIMGLVERDSSQLSTCNKTCGVKTWAWFNALWLALRYN